MSNLSISQLPSSSGLTGTEVLPIVQSGTTVKTTVQDVANLGIMAAGTGVGSTIRINNNNSALGPYSTISGGLNNIIPEGNIGTIFDYQNQVYSGNTLNGFFENISPSSTLSGLGSGATFNFQFFEGILDYTNIQFGGSNYVNGDTLTFNGTLFGGISGIDNVTLQIDVENQGSTYSIIGGGQNNTIISVIGEITSVFNDSYTGNTLDGTFSNISPSSTSSSLGSGATFSFEFFEGSLNSVTIQLRGSNYVESNTLTFDGTLFGGTSGDDDVTLEISTTSQGGYTTIGGGEDNTTGILGIIDEFFNITYTGNSLNGNFSFRQPTSTSSGLGSGAFFEFQFFDGALNDVFIQNVGSDYVNGDTLTFDGTEFDGISGIDNVTLQINTISRIGEYSTIAGGSSNTSSSCGSTVGGGLGNRALNCFSTVGGGCVNRACGSYSTIAGGYSNVTLGFNSTVGGGSDNTSINNSTIGGGRNNTASCYSSTIGGGRFNTASGEDSTVGGGCGNRASNDCSTVGGGARNCVNGNYSTIGGGFCNRVCGFGSTIGGGRINFAYGNRSTIGGGCCNYTYNERSTIGGGSFNTALGQCSTIGGGNNNSVSGYLTTIGGGGCNIALGECSTIGGGYNNRAGISTGIINGYYNRRYLSLNLEGEFLNISPTSTLSGLGSGATFNFTFYSNDNYFDVTIQDGGSNYVNEDRLTFNGTLFSGVSGTDNVTFQIFTTTAGGHSTIGGGRYNTASGCNSTIGGGNNNTVNTYSSTIGGGVNNSVGIVGVISNYYDEIYSGNILDDNFSNISPSSTSSGLGNGATFNFSFDGGLDNISIELGGSNYVNNDTLTFDGTLFGGESGVDDVTLLIETETYGSNSTIGGGGHNCASANNSTIGGGFYNTSSGCYSTVGGGVLNTSSGGYSTIGGGKQNAVSCRYSTIGGGRFNTSTGDYSIMGGGRFNTASGFVSTISGGRSNMSSGSESTIGGGAANTASGQASIIGGGAGNIASCRYSTISGGLFNLSSGYYSTIGGGRCNRASACNSAILGGICNNTSTCNDAMIIGSCITADRACTTFVNALSVKNMPTSSAGLPSGTIWSDGGTLKIVA
jgi:hypothetical protein